MRMSLPAKERKMEIPLPFPYCTGHKVCRTVAETPWKVALRLAQEFLDGADDGLGNRLPIEF